MGKDFETFESFKHGLVKSKIWLCQELENIVNKDIQYNVHILAGWTNLLGFMLIVRKSQQYQFIHSYDIDDSAISVANQITDAWNYEEPKVQNHLMNINDIDYNSHTGNLIYVNCSIEHLENRDWFTKIKKGSIVCLQATNINISDHPWYIKDYTPDVDTITHRYSLDTILYKNELPIVYSHFEYKRFMVIGIK